jgi:hypothetical protein
MTKILHNVSIYEFVGCEDDGHYETNKNSATVALAPRLTDMQYGYAVSPDSYGGRFVVEFVVVRESGSAEIMPLCNSFCGYFSTEAEAIAFATQKAAACRFGARA